MSVLAGCSPTYPKEKFKESIVKICKNEYKLDVKVETIGKTIAIYVPLEDLIDFTFAISKSASEKINDVILSVSRVALSTDAVYDFYCVIAHDIRIPEIQIVIIKSVSDVKRFLLNDVSRGEYSKRMLIDIRLSPQAQKERAIKDVFRKMNVDKKWQEQVLNDFFRSDPTALGDIGYWNSRFYIKDVSLSEFLAEQIAARTKMEFRDDKILSKVMFLKSAKGNYLTKEGRGFFRFEILADYKNFAAAQDASIPAKIVKKVFEIAASVLSSYGFKEFDYAEVLDQADGSVTKISRANLEPFRKKKVSFEEVAE
jgi:hypothetical protein